MSDNKFKTGKIYKIYNNENDKFYIGSTIFELKDRFTRHKYSLNCMCKNLGVPIKDFIIELIENYPCNSKEELLWRERFYFDKYKLEDNLNFLNKQKPIISVKEKKERLKEYRKTHKLPNEITRKYNDNFRLKNPDKIKEYNKNAHIKRKNDPKRIEWNNRKYICNLCNIEIKKNSKQRHEISRLHQVTEFLTLIENSLKNL